MQNEQNRRYGSGGLTLYPQRSLESNNCDYESLVNDGKASRAAANNPKNKNNLVIIPEIVDNESDGYTVEIQIGFENFFTPSLQDKSIEESPLTRQNKIGFPRYNSELVEK